MPFQNPVIPGFYPDPSLCRVGDDFYLANSSFEYFPGVPIWHSRDLVHWRQIGNALDRPSQLPLGRCPCSDGIYAPTLRFHDGTFVLITTLVNAGTFTNFYVTATDPAGPWSEPIRVDQSGIDPSLLFDADGRVYFQSNRGLTFAMERGIYQSEIDFATGRRLTEPRLIWKGTGGSYVEAPHLYRIDGWYYLMVAEGGTSYGHTVTIARSRDPWGPFESCPHNPILTNRHAYDTLHGAGHADLVQAADGSWWMVHLAFRKTIGDIHTLGRETCLARVEWRDGWPVVNSDGVARERMEVPTLPLHAPEPAPDDSHFAPPALGPHWIHLRNPDPSRYSLDARPGYLRLFGAAETLADLASPTFVARRQQHFAFEATTGLEFDPSTEGEEAGLSLLMTAAHHYRFSVVHKAGSRQLEVRLKLDLIDHLAGFAPLLPGPVQLRITGSKERYSFAFSQNDAPFQEIAQADTRYLGTEVTGGYNGVILGLFATGNGRNCTAPADFSGLTYTA
jgi:alpha-N-arabinofuranosidase